MAIVVTASLEKCRRPKKKEHPTEITDYSGSLRGGKQRPCPTKVRPLQRGSESETEKKEGARKKNREKKERIVIIEKSGANAR